MLHGGHQTIFFKFLNTYKNCRLQGCGYKWSFCNVESCATPIQAEYNMKHHVMLSYHYYVVLIPLRYNTIQTSSA